MSFGLLSRCLITSQIGSLPNADPKFAKFPKHFCQGNLQPPKVCFAMEHSKETCAVGKNDGVIIVDHGSRREESNLMLHEFVAKFKDKTGYQIVEPAHMELAEPSIKDAFGSCVHQGAGRVIINPFFLFPGRHWQQDEEEKRDDRKRRRGAKVEGRRDFQELGDKQTRGRRNQNRVWEDIGSCVHLQGIISYSKIFLCLQMKLQWSTQACHIS